MKGRRSARTQVSPVSEASDTEMVRALGMMIGLVRTGGARQSGSDAGELHGALRGVAAACVPDRGVGRASVWPPRLAITGELTHAERRVVSHAARGHTNQEIARRLYVTVSTVEQHLTKAYRKLGVRSRSELRSCLVIHGDQ